MNAAARGASPLVALAAVAAGGVLGLAVRELMPATVTLALGGVILALLAMLAQQTIP